MQNLRGGEPQHFIARLRTAEVVLEDAHHVGQLVVVAVALLYVPFALADEGVVLALSYLAHYLRIELAVVDGLLTRGIGINVACQLHHHESAAARLVFQWQQRVGGGAEGSIALLLLEGGGVELALLHVGALYEVFQEGGLCLRDLVVLVDVDEQEPAQCPKGLLLVREVYAVDVECHQLAGQQHPHEGGLARALPAHEHQHHLGAVHGVHACLPLAHHRAHPHLEVVAPARRCCRHAVGQLAQAVATVPLGQRVEPLAHGVVGRDKIGVDDAFQVLRPYLDALADSGVVDGISHLVGQWLPPQLVAVLLLHLHLARHAIAAEHVAALEEAIHQLLVHERALYGVLCAEAVLAVGILKRRAYQRFLQVVVAQFERELRGQLLVDTRLSASDGQPHHVVFRRLFGTEGQFTAHEVELCGIHLASRIAWQHLRVERHFTGFADDGGRQVGQWLRGLIHQHGLYGGVEEHLRVAADAEPLGAVGHHLLGLHTRRGLHIFCRPPVGILSEQGHLCCVFGQTAACQLVGQEHLQRLSAAANERQHGLRPQVHALAQPLQHIPALFHAQRQQH